MSSTLTSRLKLFKPTPGSGEQFRSTDINSNMDKIDAGGNGTFVCTSTTRPATPFTGMQIYETDTKNRWLWNATKWEPIGTILCTSATHPASPDEGWEIYETDKNRKAVWDGTNWFFTWNAPHIVLVRTTVANLNAGWNNNVGWDSAVISNDGVSFSAGTPHKLEINTNGLYEVRGSYSVDYGSTTADRLLGQILKNSIVAEIGMVARGGMNLLNPTYPAHITMDGPPVRLVSTDWLNMAVFNGIGGVAGVDENTCFLEAKWVAP